MAYDISYGITAESLICSSAANHAYFSSSCCIHTVAEKTDVFTLLVNNLNAYTVLTDWFFERNKVSHQVIEPATCYCFRGVPILQNFSSYTKIFFIFLKV